MSWATKFSEERTARTFKDQACQKCKANVAIGDQYFRSAIPPWGYEDFDGEDVFRYSVGFWEVIILCWNCFGNYNHGR